MSEPRHAIIYRDAVKKKWWLEIVTSDIYRDTDRLSDNAETFGPFTSSNNAMKFAEECFQNTGYEIPIMDNLEFKSPPSNYKNPKYLQAEMADFWNGIKERKRK